MKQITKEKIKYAIIAVAIVLMVGISIGVASAAEQKLCPRDVIATPEPGLPDDAILYQVIKIYCYKGMAWTRGLDQASPPLPIPTGSPCDMSKPFKMAGVGKPA